MAEMLRRDSIDPVREEELRTLASQEGTCVSFFLPTSRRGKETLEGPVRLRNLLRDAEGELAELGIDSTELDEILDPVRALADDADFWQHQGEGLALFASVGGVRRFRVPLALDESMTVGSRCRVWPLWPLVAGDDVFFVLALAQNEVRVYEATRHTIVEVESDEIPSSMAEALALEDHESQLQVRAVGGGDAMFHGHGAGDEVEKAALERFFRAVDDGVVSVLGPTRQPVVVAGVEYYLPIYRSVTRLPNVADVAVTGSPERRPAMELHAAALEIVGRRRATDHDALAERYAQLLAQGRVVTELPAIADAATEGRVDTLVLPPRDATGGDPEAEALLDRVVAATLERGGDIAVTSETVDIAPLPGAILRF